MPISVYDAHTAMKIDSTSKENKLFRKLLKQTIPYIEAFIPYDDCRHEPDDCCDMVCVEIAQATELLVKIKKATHDTI